MLIRSPHFTRKFKVSCKVNTRICVLVSRDLLVYYKKCSSTYFGGKFLRIIKQCHPLYYSLLFRVVGKSILAFKMQVFLRVCLLSGCRLESRKNLILKGLNLAEKSYLSVLFVCVKNSIYQILPLLSELSIDGHATKRFFGILEDQNKPFAFLISFNHHDIII